MAEKTAVIIGGSFNPVTCAHIELGRAVAAYMQDTGTRADIYYVPTNVDYISGWKDIKKDAVFNNDTRVIMLKAALEELQVSEDTDVTTHILISDIEYTGRVDGRSVNTVRHFRETLGYEDIYLVMGADKIDEFPRWYQAAELVKMVKLLIFARGDMPMDGLKADFWRDNRDRYVLMRDRVQDVSSTAVREAYYRGDMAGVRQMMPEAAYEELIHIYEEKRQ